MKTAKDLYIPCTYETRHPLLLDRFLFVPSNYRKHADFGHLDLPGLFGNSNPVNVEYCSGNGAWAAARAADSPDVNWLAVEKKFDRARKIWLKAHNQNLPNLFVVYGDALDFTDHYLQEGSVFAAFVNFPDPWPKDKHAKHRLICPAFLDCLGSVLKLGAAVTLATDNDAYAGQMIEAFFQKKWHSRFEPPYFKTVWPEYGDSYFKALWESKGLSIKYLSFDFSG